MKQSIISCLVFGLFLFLTACGKKDNNPKEVSNVDKVNREQITSGNYDPNETTIERYLRVTRTLGEYQSENEPNNSGLKTVQQEEEDICAFLQESFEADNVNSCEVQSLECSNNGALVKTITDYGTDGCLSGDQMMVGKFSYTYHDYFSEIFNGMPSEAITTEIEFENFGEIRSPKVFAYGEVLISLGDESGSGSSKSSIDYQIISANEVLTCNYTIDMVIDVDTATGEETQTVSSELQIESDQGYTVTEETTLDLKYLLSCNLELGTDEYPVSGKKKVTLTEDGQTNILVVDYGDGTCDAIYTITDEDGEETIFERDVEL